MTLMREKLKSWKRDLSGPSCAGPLAVLKSL